MAYIEQAIITRLLADSSITDIVSTRIYYMEVPEIVTYPYILIQIISDADTNMNCGIDGSNPRLQIDSIDKNNTLANVKPLDLAVRTNLNDFTGTLSGLKINIILRGGYRELKEPKNIIRLSRDFIPYYER